MEYLLLIYGNETYEAQMPQAKMDEVMAAFAEYTEALKSAGVWKGGNALHRTSAATTVSKGRVVDGPFAETKEQLGGYYLIDAPDLDAALAWAKRCPGAEFGSIEMRPIRVFSVEPEPSAAITTNA